MLQPCGDWSCKKLSTREGWPQTACQAAHHAALPSQQAPVLFCSIDWLVVWHHVVHLDVGVLPGQQLQRVEAGPDVPLCDSAQRLQRLQTCRQRVGLAASLSRRWTFSSDKRI